MILALLFLQMTLLLIDFPSSNSSNNQIFISSKYRSQIFTDDIEPGSARALTDQQHHITHFM